jgi:hypothetical protein
VHLLGFKGVQTTAEKNKVQLHFFNTRKLGFNYRWGCYGAVMGLGFILGPLISLSVTTRTDLQIPGVPVPLKSAIADRSVIPKVGWKAMSRFGTAKEPLADITTPHSNTTESAVSFLNILCTLCV